MASSVTVGEIHRHNVIALIVSDDGKYLMQLRDNIPSIRVPGHWACFGGGIEAGESPHDALIRELDEELGFTPETVTWFTDMVYVLPQIAVQPTLRSVFEVRIRGQEMVDRMVLNEGQEMRLFRLDELMQQPKVVPWDLYPVFLHANHAWRQAGTWLAESKDGGKMPAPGSEQGTPWRDGF